MRGVACTRCPEGVLFPTSAAERSPLARTAGIILIALSTPFLFYALKVLENIPAPGIDAALRVWMPLGSAGLFAGAAVPLAGAWALRRKSGGARRCSACGAVFDPDPLRRFRRRD
ncbi:MAG TPA: hypothetical protein VMT87_08310 [Vicinamibacteria bacterium]|nr:hypothetical protein [Vicinamibacteria bacterium]